MRCLNKKIYAQLTIQLRGTWKTLFKGENTDRIKIHRLSIMKEGKTLLS
jgi:hypothetical protein